MILLLLIALQGQLPPQCPTSPTSLSTNDYTPPRTIYRPYVPFTLYEVRKAQFYNQFYAQQTGIAALAARKAAHREAKLAYIRAKYGPK